LEPILIGAAVVALACATAAIKWSRKAILRRMLRSAVPTDIRDAREHAPVIIGGTVDRIPTPLVAPLSARACAAFDIVRHATDGDDLTPRTVEARGTEFVVRDRTGKARVMLGHTRNFQILLERNAVTRDLKTLDRSTKEVARLIALAEVSATDAAVPDGGRFIEHVLLIGAEVIVAGAGVWHADSTPDARSGAYREAARIFVMDARKDFALIVADDPTLVQRHDATSRPGR
jgi:hypothetical protein